jgi:hypothetical protein
LHVYAREHREPSQGQRDALRRQFLLRDIALRHIAR